MKDLALPTLGAWAVMTTVRRYAVGTGGKPGPLNHWLGTPKIIGLEMASIGVGLLLTKVLLR